MTTFSDQSLPIAWASAAKFLCQPGAKDFVWTVRAGAMWEPTSEALKRIDRAAQKHSWERPSSVSEMILPAVCETEGYDPEYALARGLEMLGRARALGANFSGWRHTYFERLVGSWIDKHGEHSSFRSNKLLRLSAS